jgi:adenylosuccinate synthase
VYDLQKEAQKSFQDVYKNNPSPQERAEALKGMYQEFDAAARKVVGTEKWDKLSQDNQQWWLRNLKSQAGVK